MLAFSFWENSMSRLRQDLIEEYKNNIEKMITDFDDYDSKVKCMRSNHAAKRNRKIATIIEQKHPELKASFVELLDSEDFEIKMWVAHHIVEVMNYDKAIRLRALDLIIYRALHDEYDFNKMGESMWLNRYFDEHPEDNVTGWNWKFDPSTVDYDLVRQHNIR